MEALPVGVASRAEWLGLTLREEIDPAQLAAKLRGKLPRGMNILYAEKLPMHKHLPQAISESYLLEFLPPIRQNDDACAHSAECFAAWKAFAAEESRSWVKEGKKGSREYDLRAFFLEISEIEDNGRPCLRLTFDWSKDYASPLAIVLAVTPELGVERVLLTKLAQMF